MNHYKHFSSVNFMSKIVFWVKQKLAIIAKHLYEGGGFRCNSALCFFIIWILYSMNNSNTNYTWTTIHLISTQNVSSEALATFFIFYDVIWWRHNDAKSISLYIIYFTSPKLHFRVLVFMIGLLAALKIVERK